MLRFKLSLTVILSGAFGWIACSDILQVLREEGLAGLGIFDWFLVAIFIYLIATSVRSLVVDWNYELRNAPEQ